MAWKSHGANWGIVDDDDPQVRDPAEFLQEKFAAASTATAITLPALSGSVERTVADKVGERVSVKDYGAVGDGVSRPVSQWLTGGARDRGYADLAAIQVDYPHVGALTNEVDWAAIQKAIEVVAARGGGAAYVPGVNTAGGEYYRTDLPLFLRSFVSLEGDGPSSLIYNTRTSPGTVFNDTAVILPGNYHPFYANSLTYDAVANPTEGDAGLTLSTPSQHSRYSVGMTVIARTDDFTPESTTDVSEWLRFYRITDINTSTGELTFDKPIDETNADVLISPADGEVDWRSITGLTQQQAYVCYRGALRNLGIKSNRWWIADSGALECIFENLHIEAEAAVYGNAFQRCSWETIRGSFNRIFMELSMNSFATSIRDVEMAYVGTNADNYQLGSFQEKADSCYLDGFVIHAPSWSRTAAAFRMVGKRCAMRNGQLNVPSAAGVILAVDPASGASNDNEFDSITMRIGASCTGAVNIVPTGTGTAARNRAARIRVLGTGPGSSWVALKLGGTDNEMDRCVVESATAQLQVVTGAAGCRATRNKVPNGITYSDGGVTLSRTNVVEQNYSTSSESLRRGRFKQAGGRTDITSTTANNQVQSLSIPGGSLAAGDVILMHSQGDTGAEAVAKEIRHVFGGNVVGSLSLASGETGLWSITTRLVVRNTNELYAISEEVKAGAAVFTRYNLTGFGLTSTAYALDLRAWLDGAGHIYVEDYQFDPRKPGFAA